MAVLTATQSIAESRLLAGDTDATDPALTDANYSSLYAKALLLYQEKVEPRFQRINASTSGLTLTGLYSKITTIATIAEIKDLWLMDETGSATSVDGAGLIFPERIKVNEIMAELIALNFQTNLNSGYRWAAERLQTSTAADMGKWTIYINQLHDSSAAKKLYAIIHARLVQAVPTTTASPDITEEGSYIVARFVAAEAARLMGEEGEFIERILAPISEDVRAKMGAYSYALRPRGAMEDRAA